MEHEVLCPDCQDAQLITRLRYLSHGLRVLADLLKEKEHGPAAIAWGLALESWSVADLMETDVGAI